jgi:hypothetical protein
MQNPDEGCQYNWHSVLVIDHVELIIPLLLANKTKPACLLPSPSNTSGKRIQQRNQTTM